MWIWFPEGKEGLIGSLRRATVTKTDDSGTQQILKKMTGLKTEQFEDVYRPQPHGFSSHAPSGAEGLYLALGGRSDRLVALGFEHKDYRPKNTPEGGTIIYDHTGDAIRVVKDKIDLVHAGEINLKIAKGYDKGDAVDQTDGAVIAFVMKKGDSLTLTYDDTSVKLQSGKATVTSPHVVVQSDHVDLGAEGGQPVALCGGGCATKVFAV
jgi:phage gp45-like